MTKNEKERFDQTSYLSGVLHAYSESSESANVVKEQL